MSWKVELSSKGYKSLKKIPKRTKESFQVLLDEIRTLGPVRGNWPNYGKLSKDCHHCHLQKKGKPVYVAVWKVTDKEIKIIEVNYVGTHEGANYDLLR
jgi:hypothetical protein